MINGWPFHSSLMNAHFWQYEVKNAWRYRTLQHFYELERKQVITFLFLRELSLYCCEIKSLQCHWTFHYKSCVFYYSLLFLYFLFHHTLTEHEIQEPRKHTIVSSVLLNINIFFLHILHYSCWSCMKFNPFQTIGSYLGVMHEQETTQRQEAGKLGLMGGWVRWIRNRACSEYVERIIPKQWGLYPPYNLLHTKHHNIMCNLRSKTSYHRKRDQWDAHCGSKSPLFESH